MGLLNMFGGSPGQQGLLAGSMAMLNAGGPSRMPISLGQALAQGMGAGQVGYNSAIKRQQDEQEFELAKRYREAQMQKMQQEEDRKAQSQRLIDEFMKGSADPEKFVSAFSIAGNAPMAALAQRRADAAKAENEKQGLIRSMQPTFVDVDPNAPPSDNSPQAIAARPKSQVSENGLFGPLLANAVGMPASYQNEVIAAANRNASDPLWAPKDRQAEFQRLSKMIEDYNAEKRAQAGREWTEQQRAQDRMAERQFMVDNRAPPAEPAPSQATILDPADPSKMISVDARKWNPVTREGYIGVSGKEPTAAKKEEQAATGKREVSDSVARLRDYYRQLSDNSGIVDAEKGAVSNIAARLSSTAGGQFAGQLVGTKNQRLRDTIEQQRPLLLQAIKNATGMSAKQMDSNVELKMYLAAATDPTKDIQANLDALDNLERLYGGGVQTKAATVESLPTANASNKGRRARDTATGKIFRSNGVSWVEEK